MNPLLSRLQPYPFERLRQLHASVTPNPDFRPISLGIGEPRHATPQLIKDALTASLAGLSSYPATLGEPKLRQTIADWLKRRYTITVDPATQILPVNGSREALFALAQTVIDPTRASARPPPGRPKGGSEAHAVASVGAISAAPMGNAGVLPISWMYCRMMGPDGLKQATEVAILSANYISAKLKGHYPTLYASENGHVAHECILDLRPLKETSGVTAEDVSKRLMDYGFHAPTLSFPVPGTLMVEPTESETLAELDRFIDAMIAIREEIRQVESGHWPQGNNPLTHAPHTAASLMAAEWDRPYSRETAAFPVAALKRVKYWPTTGRVDNAWGDRNLSCSCVPVSEYA